MELGELLIGRHFYVLGEWHTPTPRGQKLLHLGPCQTLPYVPLHLTVLVSYPLQSISKHVSLSSVSHYSKLLNLGKGSQEPQSVVKSKPGPTACDWCLKLGAALWD